MITVRRVSPPTTAPSSRSIDDYDVVVIGLAHLFDAYADRIVIAELDTNQPLTDTVDIALYDSFAQPEADHDDIGVLVRNPCARHVVVYTWNFHPDLIDQRPRQGRRRVPLQDPAGPPARHRPRSPSPPVSIVISDPPPRSRVNAGLDWPGRTEGLTDREAEVIALITQGKTNTELAELMYLSINTVKTYIRSAYRKIGVTSRPKAMLWGIQHGFQPDHHRIDHWRGGP